MAGLVNISEAASLALHTMALLATKPEQCRSTRELAEPFGASGHHLAKVMQQLARVGLVVSTRGPHGGFQLGRSSEEIRLLDIYEAIEGPIEEDCCLFSSPPCHRMACQLGRMVRSAHQQLRASLKKTTLAQLAESLSACTLGQISQDGAR